jgi:hypothetical protein
MDVLQGTAFSELVILAGYPLSRSPLGSIFGNSELVMPDNELGIIHCVEF